MPACAGLLTRVFHTCGCNICSSGIEHDFTASFFNYRDSDLSAAQCFIAAAVAKAISGYEPVSIIVPAAAVTGTRALLGTSTAISIVIQPTEDLWARDSLTVFVLE